MHVRLTQAVKIILIASFLVFLVQQTGDQFFGTHLLGWFGLVPADFIFQHWFWQVFTYAFLHGDVMHLFLNMMMLVFIGSELEVLWGTQRFLTYYFCCSVSAGVSYLLLQLVLWREGGLHSPMIGASGAIYGLLMAYGLIFGERILLFMMLFPMKAKHFIWILAGVEFMSTVFSGRSGLAGVAHLGGMVAGFLYLWGRAVHSLAKKRKAQSIASGKAWKKKPRKGVNHLKLIVNNEQDLNAGEDDVDDNPKTWH